MKCFANYFGGKTKLAPRYGRPQREHVIEPFAGFAGYSTVWEPKKVTLIERDHVVCGVWKFLRRASASEIMALPVGINSLDELPPHLCQEARDLIGFWLQRGKEKPTKRLSQQTRDGRFRYNFWESPIRHRIASQVERIKHWHIIEGDYTEAPDVEAHWFVDPPYEKAGVAYVHNQIDRAALAAMVPQPQGLRAGL